MSKLQDLIAQQAALQKDIDRMRAAERTEAIAKVKSLMAEYELTPQDLGANQRGRPKFAAGKATAKVAAKFRDASTGQTWSGRGLQPNWLKAHVAAGKKAEEFAV